MMARMIEITTPDVAGKIIFSLLGSSSETNTNTQFIANPYPQKLNASTILITNYRNYNSF